MIPFIQYKLEGKIIKKKRDIVYKSLIEASPNINNGNIKEISETDLELLFSLYNQVFLENRLKKDFKGTFSFSLSKRMTKSAGLILYSKNINKMKSEGEKIEIRIGVDFFLQYDLLEGKKTVCGIDTKNSLEALQLVFEHEICHAIEYIYFKKSSCKGERFKTISNNLFGHTESYHQLPTYRQIANKKLGLKIGDQVSFTFQGKKVDGIIYRINKRATVMVKDKKGQFIDKEGNRYIKYYVPLTAF
ncbi:SprT-like domain-containing protein [Clostridium formicaceticum]|uniref:SprT-like family protein n=1 Tax=Clostridium formicaceticum TaxID=1497 RepID=A0AAC9RQ48_9CLOT|nr:SprT-like domain-containing protein [Clostridium formicaceticum]AOY74557.1 hypothetical protein BJL90_00455 [Clostridium formicaceticum]ARE88913.1 SprT-like family protein [Clostridium formicaceticum]